MEREELRRKIFGVPASEFDELALRVFRFQYEQNAVYKRFCSRLNKSPDNVSGITGIPFLPVELFKTHRVVAGAYPHALVFESSGTTGSVPSRHYLPDPSLYQESFTRSFRIFFGAPSDWVMLALLPSYLGRSGSSLVYMVDQLMQQSGRSENGFYLSDHGSLYRRLQQTEASGTRALLWGVSFALLDFAEYSKLKLRHTVIVETGGMKGRRREIIREELHERLKDAFGVDQICSEYGMTEMLSQAYALQHGVFESPPWLRIMARELNDPLEAGVRSGAANIIDLANLDSCSFLATADLVKIHGDHRFEVLGRTDNEDIRGCNLMVD